MNLLKPIMLVTLLMTVTNYSYGAPTNNTNHLPPAEYRDAGGPDAYGYTWADSNEVGGPAFNWIDITGIGTEVIGLSDDNSVPMLPMGMNFQYYWITFSDLKIGSNGWLSFDDVGNVAHCFPTTPTAGGSGDNLIAPFMTDLNFAGVGNPGQVFYYHDALNEAFIVSYINAPWWVITSPNFIGSNTFQVIFSAVDNSITYQYLDVDPASFNDTVGCAADLEIGFENNTGNIGLELFNDQVPADNYAIKISYPDVPLIDIEDPAPIWNQAADNKAVFALAGDDVNLVTHVKNAGNVDTTTAIDVTMTVFDQTELQVYSELENLTGLMAQEETDVAYTLPFNSGAGNYRLEATTSSSSDINPSNNINNSELNLIDQTVSPVQLSYVTEDIATGALTWSGGDGGGGTYFQPPFMGWHIDSVEMFIATDGLGSPGPDFVISIYANDGGDGLPGTVLDTFVVAAGSYTGDSFNLFELASPILAPDEGFFVGWDQNSSVGVSLGTVDTLPISRQSYEQLSGQWATYRSNETNDLMIKVNMIDLIFANGFE